MIKEIIKTNKAPGAIGPYSQATKANNLIFVSGQIPIDPQSGLIVEGGIYEQTQQVLKNIEAILEAAGSNVSRVVKTTVFLASLDDFGRMNEAYAQVFETDPPARATVQVARLPRDVRIEIDAIALS